MSFQQQLNSKYGALSDRESSNLSPASSMRALSTLSGTDLVSMLAERKRLRTRRRIRQWLLAVALISSLVLVLIIGA